MGDMMSGFGSALGPAAIIMGAVLGIFIVASMFWVKSAIKGKVYCHFLSENKQLQSRLLKPSANVIVVEESGVARKYLTHPSKLFWSYWPPGFPKIIQEPVPSLFYISSSAEPLDPFDQQSLISPESLMRMSDEAMLKQTWKDVREASGLRAKPKIDTLLLLLIGLAFAASALSAYFGYSMSGKLDALIKMFGGG